MFLVRAMGGSVLSHSLPFPLVTRSIKSSACPHSHVFAFIYFVALALLFLGVLLWHWRTACCFMLCVQGSTKHAR